MANIVDEELSGRIIKAFYKVYNALGHGFLESIYHNSLLLELVAEGLAVETEKPIAVYYEGKVVGTFSADLIVGGKIILELKAKETIHPAHEAQLINYLRATDVEVGLLLNFGKSPEFKRKYFSNKNKRRIDTFSEHEFLDILFEKDPEESA
ncbi:MAG: GxxExxY protein [Pyrinomonadaceae bacterium]